MSVQSHTRIDYEWITFSKARVLAQLEAEFTEREGANNLAMPYETFRSAVEDIKQRIGLSSVKEIRWWWRENYEPWCQWLAVQGKAERTVPKVG